MDINHHEHEQLIAKVKEQYREILINSKQAIYIYLDDVHKVGNEKFASMLGFESVKEWEVIKDTFTEAFVADESQHILVSTYMRAMEDKVGAQINVVWKKRDGSEVNSTVILVPIVVGGEFLALHFITQS